MDDQIYYRTRNPRSKTHPVISSHIKEILGVINIPLKTLKTFRILDVGSGQGEYCFEVEKYVKEVVGIEPFKPAFEKAIQLKNEKRSTVKFYNLPIEDYDDKRKFDLVLCLTVIEHMQNAEGSFQKIFSLMNDNAIMYLSAPNKLWPIESHYKLPFLSYLPLHLANLYMRLTRKGNSYLNSSFSKTYFGMKKFFNKFDCEYSFVLPQNINTPFMGCGSGGLPYKLLMKIGIFLIRRLPIFWALSKGFIMIIRRKSKDFLK